MTKYYVDNETGNNTNSGLSWAAAFKTLAKVQAVAGANDEVYVRGGPYYEKVNVDADGQKWYGVAKTGGPERPIIDGKYNDSLYSGSGDGGLINVLKNPPNAFVVQVVQTPVVPAIFVVDGQNCVVDGFVIQNVAGRGVLITGSYSVMRNCKVDFCWAQTISVIPRPPASCRGVLVEDCETSRSGVNWWARYDRDAMRGTVGDNSLIGTPTGNTMNNVTDCTFRRVTAHHMYGESMMHDSGSVGCVIEYCTTWASGHVAYYINAATDCVIRYCTAWELSVPEYNNINDKASQCYQLNDEGPQIGQNRRGQRGSRVYGNLGVGNNFVFVWSSKNEGGNCYIGYNTFVSVPTTGVNKPTIKVEALTAAWIDEIKRKHGVNLAQRNTDIFENNIIVDMVGEGVLAARGAPLKARNNLYWQAKGVKKAVAAWLANAPGTINADPKMVNPGATIIDNGGFFAKPVDGSNNFDEHNYWLTASSPAIGAAAVGGYPFNGVTAPPDAYGRDMYGRQRTDPDMGFHEYGGPVSPYVTAAFSAAPSATTVVVGTEVHFVDGSFAGGGASITGRTWRVRKSGQLVATGSAATFEHTFATDGSYTVELEVTASGGLSDAETRAYTVTTSSGGVVVTAAFDAQPPQTTVEQGQTVTFFDASTAQNATINSRLWQVRELPSLDVIAEEADTTVFTHTFDTVGEFRVLLLVGTPGGASDVEQSDYTVTASTSTTLIASFTSSDADNRVAVGTAVTFTNTSSVSGTTISGYEWTVARDGESEATVPATSTNFSYAFNQSGTWIVRLRATAANGLTSDATQAVVVQQAVTVGTDILAVPVTFALSTSTGTQTITSAALEGKTPKGAHVRLVGATVAGTAAADLLWGEGATDGVQQWAHARWSKDDTATSTAWRRGDDSALLLTIGASGAVTGRATFGQFVAGGMEIEIDDAFPAGYLAEVTFYAGDKMSFWAGTVALGTAETPTVVPTGINQDAVYIASGYGENDTATANASLTQGWATKDGAQYCVTFIDVHGATPTRPTTRLTAGVSWASEGDPGLTTIRAADFTPEGFTLTPNKTLGRSCGVFAFGLGGEYEAALRLVEQATSGETSLALPWEAQTIQAITTSFTQDAGKLGGADAVASGWYSQSIHGPAETSMALGVRTGTATSSTRSLRVSGFRGINGAGVDLWAGTGTLDGDVWSASYTTSPALAYRMLVLAIQAGTEVEEIPDDPIADFTAEIDPATAAGRAAVWFDSSLSSGNGEAITGYLWDFGDGSTSTEANPLHIYDLPGEYTVTLTITTAAGTATKTVENFVIVIQDEAQPDQLVGLSPPLTVTDTTENYIDEDGYHSHAARFERLPLLPLATAEAVTAFLDEAIDSEYALLAWDEVNGRLIVKATDGTNWAVTAAAL